MAKSSRKPTSRGAPSNSEPRRTAESYDSYETYESRSTAPSSYYTSTQTSVKEVSPPQKIFQPSYEEDISPNTSCCPRSSTETYDSTLASDDDLPAHGSGGADYPYDDYYTQQQQQQQHDHYIPPLPVYRPEYVDPDVVRPSNPRDFAKLFPSTNRLSIRHDDFTQDGNMNLRVDTLVPGARRRMAMQLFHLRMYDLGKREFSLRRYCRDSGREVCNAKRKYVDVPAPAASSPFEAGPSDGSAAASTTPVRSVSSALRSFGSAAARKTTGQPSRTTASSGGSLFSNKSKDHLSGNKRPDTSSSTPGGGDQPPTGDYFGLPRSNNNNNSNSAAVAPPQPTNTIKLEFSNYARVDVSRRGSKASKRYEFAWWGHRYAWKRVVDKNLGGVAAYHLVRDGQTAAPIAHIVPETRSPDQVLVDEHAGGWVPPCHMWISDRSVLDAATDVADVIVATGLMALVDDCIKERWGRKKNPPRDDDQDYVRRIPVPLTSRTVDLPLGRSRSFMQQLFQRRMSSDQPRSPLRFGRAISAY